MNLKNAVQEELKHIADRIIAVRRHIHKQPELSHEEIRTASYVAGLLENEGIRVTRGVAGTGLTAEIGDTSYGRKVAFRCDLDALPVTEDTGCEYASVHPGIMHACGHDAHTAVVVGTALLLNKLKTELKGCVKLIFQPAEEALSGGAELVVKEGVVDDVEAAFGIHVDPGLAAGKFGLKNDAMMASVDFFDVEIKGTGGHGARPHETSDTVLAAAQTVQAVYQIPPRYFSSLENPVVLSIGQISGGTAHNIIPDACTFAGTFRTFADEDRRRLRDLLTQTVKETARRFNAEGTVRITPNAPPVINDAALGKLIESAVTDLFGVEAVERLKFPMTASEDFAYYREKCPIYFLRIGVASDRTTSYPLHHSKFNIDEKAIPQTVELMSHVLIRYFE